MKKRIFLVCLFTVFLDCRSTNLLRLFSGNLPAMLLKFNKKIKMKGNFKVLKKHRNGKRLLGGLGGGGGGGWGERSR